MGSITRCPLCQTELRPSSIKKDTEEDIYPKIVKKKDNDAFIIKVVGFITIDISLFSIFLNMLFVKQKFWSLIIILVAGAIWISTVIAVTKHRSILKYLWQQTIVVTIVALIIDFLVGKQGWGITFILPIMLTISIIVMYTLSKILHLEAGDYMIYILLDALLGMIPLIVLRTSFEMITPIPSCICVLTSLISVIGLILFDGKEMLSELKKRFYI